MDGPLADARGESRGTGPPSMDLSAVTVKRAQKSAVAVTKNSRDIPRCVLLLGSLVGH